MWSSPRTARVRPRRRAAAAILLAAALASGCATFSGINAPLRDRYGRGDFAEAEEFVDQRIAAEAGVKEEVVRKSGGVDDSIQPWRGDTVLYLLDKGMLRLAAGDPKGAVRVWRSARDQLDDNFLNDTDRFVGGFAAALADDTVRVYTAADYEHILLRAMLCLADLMEGGGDAYAYAVQVGEKQEEIIGSPLGDVVKDGRQVGYRPRSQYKRVGLGAYLQGVIREDSLDYDEAGRAYERAVAFSEMQSPLLEGSLSRVRNRSAASPGEGVLHVFYLGGRGPHLEEVRATPGNDAFRLAGLLVFLVHGSPWLLTQAPVPVPHVAVNDADVLPLEVRSGDRSTTTDVILDVNRVAREQNDANMPWTVARALVRRTWKAVAGTAAQGVAQSSRNDLVAVGALAAAIALNVATTATENADTRSWSTLPAQFQAARLELPAGIRRVDLGPDLSCEVRIAPGRASYVLVIRPSEGRPAAVLVDRYTRPPKPS
ncbi:MAG TPA: hypothetical protein VIU40_11005 [Geobacteraceae bacterium]